MDKSTEKIYSLLQSVFSLSSLLTAPLSKSTQFSDRTITYVPHEENDYFHLGAFIEQDHRDGIDTYNEIVVRIWKNKKAEVDSLRQAHIGHYEETYSRKQGVEYARPHIRIEANSFLSAWLVSLLKEHGNLRLQHVQE